MLAAFAWLVERSWVARVRDPNAEALKIDLLRVLVGVVLVSRTASMLEAAELYFDPAIQFLGLRVTRELLLTLGTLALGTAFTVGIFTPLATVGLLVTIKGVDSALESYTLGTSILLLHLAMFLTASAGQRLSVDAWLMRARPDGALTRLVTALHVPFGRPTAERLRAIYFLGFLAYALTSLGAMLLHIHDPYWVRGQTVAVMSTHSYIGRWWAAARVLEEAAPIVLHGLSVIGIAGQTFFQLGMIPLVFHRWGRWYVIGWGFVFFALSLLCFQLSYLPPIELSYWTLLFVAAPRWPTALPGPAVGPGWKRLRVLVGVWATVLLAAFVVVIADMHDWLPGRDSRTGLQYALARYGLQVPNVFNRQDLGTSDRWPVIERVDSQGRISLVPLNGPDGERLDYHDSDVLYSGNSARWRRGIQGQDVQEFHAPGAPGLQLLASLVRFDCRRQGGGPLKYRIRIYESRGSDVSIQDADKRYGARLVHALELACGR